MSRPVLVLPKVHSVKSRHEPKVYKEQEPPKHNQVSISSVWPNKEKLLQIRQSKTHKHQFAFKNKVCKREKPSTQIYITCSPATFIVGIK